ncbi:MAG: metallophosphoesterase [Bacteroidales bacterium]|nr:metallophosphoesterase [Bacteroidales bacterium]
MKIDKKIKYYIPLYILFVFVSLSYTTNDIENTKKPDVSYFTNSKITDGPYFFIDEDNSVTVKWIKRSRPFETKIKNNNHRKIQRKIGFTFDSTFLDFADKQSIDYKQEFTGVDKFIALSDIHGQFDLFAKILLKYEIIDEDFNWNFGKSHLIINGDIFDRGDKVTETFWLIYRLEKQAKEAGGKVHFLLGNHELMILNKDFRYVNEKYLLTSKLLELTYDQLFSENTVAGKWLRKQPVVFSINDVLFTHAGISPEFVNLGITAEEANRKFLNCNYSLVKDSLQMFLEGTYGPLWYRGYFTDSTFTEQKLDEILHYFNKDHIVVGHTTMPNILYLHSGKLLCIDSGIKTKQYGEVLIYENGEFFRGTPYGHIIKL